MVAVIGDLTVRIEGTPKLGAFSIFAVGFPISAMPGDFDCGGGGRNWGPYCPIEALKAELKKPQFRGYFDFGGGALDCGHHYPNKGRWPQ
ncbi:hypothetical protein CRG98_013784 [Punica granatum]|uniref:Uncharacterized protein n=1 Tax=Punica granatum TaxID=22663 RepID=A0A2I0KCC2_PUNGR|nr:hypothetical protein CRG98_013784 [Punica granatum]